MKYKLILISCLFTSLLISSGNPEEHSDPNIVPGKLIIQLDGGSRQQVLSELQASFSFAGFRPERCLSKDMGIWLISYEEAAIKGNDLLMQLRSDKHIVRAQHDHRVSLREVFPDDVSFAMQWALYNIGQTGGHVDADIDATNAWEIEVNSGTTALGDTIIIAVVDDGFELGHEDLNFWKNRHEIPDNGIDDDNNGYIDDYEGWNAYTATGSIPSKSHGTLVAGIAGAVGNNGIGISGIGWNCKVMPVAGSATFESTVVAAYAYVYKMRSLYEETNGEKGAFIVVTNSSFGVDFADPEDYPIWGMMYDSLGSLGILSAAATMNKAWNVEAVGDVPTNFTSDQLIGVTNTTNKDVKYESAAWGPVSIDLGAPGSNIISTRPGNSYGYSTGTSMASPQVAGSIALLFAAADEAFLQQYADQPAETAVFLKNMILDFVDTLSGFDTLCLSGGRLNVDRAMRALLSPRMEVATDTVCVYLGPDTTAHRSIELLNLRGFELGYFCNFQSSLPEWIAYYPAAGFIPEYGGSYLGIGFRTAGVAFGTYYSVLEISDQGGWLTPLVLELHVIPNMGVADGQAEHHPLISCYPNPFYGPLMINLDLEQAGDFRFQVFSLSGAMVYSGTEHTALPGIHTISWDGMDSSGNHIPPGIYIIQITGKGFREQLKAVKSSR